MHAKTYGAGVGAAAGPAPVLPGFIVYTMARISVRTHARTENGKQISGVDKATHAHAHLTQIAFKYTHTQFVDNIKQRISPPKDEAGGGGLVWVG